MTDSTSAAGAEAATAGIAEASSDQSISDASAAFAGAADGTECVSFWLRLVRHGETDANVRRVCEAASDTPLNDTGRQQARALGRAWRDQNVTFQRVYCSDIERVQQTCRLALTECPTAWPHPDDVTSEPLLRERHMGSLHGVDYDEAIRRRRQAEAEGASIDGLESSEAMIARLAAFFQRVCDDMRSHNSQHAEALAFSHGGAIYTLLIYLQTMCGLRLEHLQPLSRLHASPNAAQTRLHVRWHVARRQTHVTCQMLYCDRHVPRHLRADHLLTPDGAKIARPEQ